MLPWFANITPWILNGNSSEKLIQSKATLPRLSIKESTNAKCHLGLGLRTAALKEMLINTFAPGHGTDTLTSIRFWPICILLIISKEYSLLLILKMSDFKISKGFEERI